MTICALFTAVLLCLSVVCCEVVSPNNTQSGSSNGSGSGIINVTDALGSQLDTTQFMDSDLLSSSQAKTKATEQGAS